MYASAVYDTYVKEYRSCPNASVTECTAVHSSLLITTIKGKLNKITTL